MIRKAWFSSLFVWVSLGVLLQAQTCERGDTFLLSLSLVVDGEEQIQGFNINNRSGYSVTTTGTTGTLTVQTRMEDSTATYQWIVDGTTIEANNIGLGGGTVQVTIPDGQSRLFIGVRAAEGNADGYWVDVERTDPVPFPCTEQGILDAIAAGGGPHTFDCAGPTTIITSDYIDIVNDVVLDGADITLDGGGTHGLISIPAGVTAELRGFTIRGAGGLGQIAFVSAGDATLRDVDFLDNFPVNTAVGAVRNSGTLTVVGGLYSGNGVDPCGPVSCGTPEARDILSSGIANLYGVTSETSVANATTLVDNEVVRLGELNIFDSMLNGVFYPDSLVNCTVAELGAVVAGFGSTEVVNSTLLGGLLWGGDAPAVRNSIVTFVSGDPVVSGGFNVFTGFAPPEFGCGDCGFTEPTDQVVTAAEVNLGPLQDNGGPTDTFLPGPGSIAIDAIPVADCLDADGLPLATDQRGIARPQGTACDIGAVEVEQP